MHNLVPHFIAEQYALGLRAGRLTAATMFVDISGFSTITSTLMGHGQYGAEVLASVMGDVFSPLIRSVYAHEGYIAGFAGDAFTAIFPAGAHTPLPAAARHALQAGWQIQQQMQQQPHHATPFGEFTVSAKVGLAAGPVTWGIIEAAQGQRAAYYYRGPAIDACAAAEHQASQGDIILDGSLYHLLGDQAAAVPLNGCWQVTALHTAPRPGTAPVHLPPLSAAQQAPFFSPALTTQTLRGEFRDIFNLFIKLSRAPSDDELNQFMQTLFQLQERYGGLLNRIDFGDKGCHLLLFWGAPVSYENDVSRVLSFILELQAQSPLPLHAGITFRIAHAGFIGSPLREDYTCYGQGVNLAARFMTSAPAGEIWLDQDVVNWAGSHFAVAFAGKQTFKGFPQPQPVYRLVGRQTATPPFFTSPMVGRQAEMARLARFIQPLFAGRFAGRLHIEGEPGIGKSRLAHEFFAHNPDVTACSLFICQTDEILRQSFNPFRYWLRDYFAQAALAGELENKARFTDRLERLVAGTPEVALRVELERTRSFLGALLDLHWPDSLYEQLEPQLRFENTLAALKALIKAESLRRPVILYLEDAHWLDEASRRLLASLTRNVAGYPLALILTSRPGPDDLPAGDETIRLDSLSESETAALVVAHTHTPAAPELVRLLQDRADGNPFFTEQILLYLQEQALLETGPAGLRPIPQARPAAALPADVRPILVARLDRLAQPVKEVVQTAAVLGREFEIPLLAHMRGNDPATRQEVLSAQGANVWTPINEQRFIFRHMLLRDVAYDMQLHARRRQLHQQAAQAYESIYQADLAPSYRQIAYHYDQAEVVVKALHYYERAAEQARQNYQNEEALAHYQRALALAELPDAATRSRLLLGREAIYSLLGQREAQQVVLAELATLVTRPEAAALQAEVALRQAAYELAMGNYAPAGAAAQQAITLAAQRQDTLAEARAWQRLGRSLWQAGHYKKAQPHLARALDLARRSSSPTDEAHCLYDLGAIYYYQADYEQAWRYVAQAQAAYQASRDQWGELKCLNLFGTIQYASGHYVAADEKFAESLALCRAIGWRYGEARILAQLGSNYFELGDYAAARTYHEQALQVCRDIDDKEDESISLDTLGLIFHYLGDPGRARTYYEAALAIEAAIDNQRSQGYILTHLGYTLVALGDYPAASARLAEALAIRRALGADAEAIDTLGGLALAAQAGGDLAGAARLARDILAWIAANGTVGIELPVQIYLICYRILQAANDPAGAAVLAAGHTLLQERAASIQDEVLRQQFLQAVPFNRALLALLS